MRFDFTLNSYVIAAYETAECNAESCLSASLSEFKPAREERPTERYAVYRGFEEFRFRNLLN